MTSLTRRKILITFFAGAWIFLLWKLFIETPEDTFSPSVNGSKTILLWTTFFGEKDYFPSMDYCSKKCVVTTDKNLLLNSDAVVFHLRDTDVRKLPKERSANQRWILLHHEAPPNTPDILRDLDGLMNWTATYRLDSDIVLTPRARLKKTPYKPQPKINHLQNKTNNVVWFVSNCKTPSNREGYVTELQKTINVDIVGDCGTLQCKPKMSKTCYESYTNSYRFYLSFENSVCKDYVTEKFFNVLDYDILPIVFTGADLTKIAPDKSYINALDFASPKELGEFLLELAKDEERYNSYFEWKQKYEIYIKPYSCQICEKVHSFEPVKIWHNLNEWFFDLSKCRKWPGAL